MQPNRFQDIQIYSNEVINMHEQEQHLYTFNNKMYTTMTSQKKTTTYNWQILTTYF